MESAALIDFRRAVAKLSKADLEYMRQDISSYVGRSLVKKIRALKRCSICSLLLPAERIVTDLKRHGHRRRFACDACAQYCGPCGEFYVGPLARVMHQACFDAAERECVGHEWDDMDRCALCLISKRDCTHVRWKDGFCSTCQIKSPCSECGQADWDLLCGHCWSHVCMECSKKRHVYQYVPICGLY